MRITSRHCKRLRSLGWKDLRRNARRWWCSPVDSDPDAFVWTTPEALKMQQQRDTKNKGKDNDNGTS